MFDDFPEPAGAVIFGASGGIGAAMVRRLCDEANVARVFAFSRSPAQATNDRLITGRFDLEDEASISAAAQIVAQHGGARLVIVATGRLHDGASMQPEKDWRALRADQLAHSFMLNTIGPSLIAKHFLPLFPRSGRAVFAALSARVGSIGDNRVGGWYGYRASKAALNMMLRNFAIELARKRPEAICVGLHPGTVDTDLSKPFQSGTSAEKLFSPDYSAGRLLEVLDGLRAGDTGGVFAWDGKRIAE
jgi:NAD(P)-dependent dehydrogenase (short-subunit alcohol dehydrogenase family)